MEEFARNVAYHLSIVVELCAAAVIAVALLKFVYAYAITLTSKPNRYANSQLRIKFGSSLMLALELLLAADVLITAVAPTWDDIGKLAAIAAIRTALNYFLEKELANEEHKPTGAPNGNLD